MHYTLKKAHIQILLNAFFLTINMWNKSSDTTVTNTFSMVNPLPASAYFYLYY